MQTNFKEFMKNCRVLLILAENAPITPCEVTP
jgi:hypothetical protein